MELHLKVTPEATPSAVKSVGAAARNLGAHHVRRLFPGRQDPLRRSLFIVDLDDDADPQTVSAALRGHDAVESVEPAFERELA